MKKPLKMHNYLCTALWLGVELEAITSDRLELPWLVEQQSGADLLTNRCIENLIQLFYSDGDCTNPAILYKLMTASTMNITSFISLNTYCKPGPSSVSCACATTRVISSRLIMPPVGFAELKTHS
jgi:hypothetical protein